MPFKEFSEAATAIVSVVGAGATGLWTYVQWRRTEVRRGELLAWSDRCIDALQTVAVLTGRDSASLFTHVERAERMRALAIATSVLVEQGRLLFRNHVGDEDKREESKAHSGVRPAILDPLMDAHILAKNWQMLNAADKKTLSEEARFSSKRFVSLMQIEIGRPQKYASPEAGARGLPTATVPSLLARARRRPPKDAVTNK